MFSSGIDINLLNVVNSQSLSLYSSLNTSMLELMKCSSAQSGTFHDSDYKRSIANIKLNQRIADEIFAESETGGMRTVSAPKLKSGKYVDEFGKEVEENPLDDAEFPNTSVDIPEQDQRRISLIDVAPFVLQPLQSRFIWDACYLYVKARNGLVLSRSAQIPSGILWFDYDRQKDIFKRIEAKLFGAKTDTPIDQPKTFPNTPSTGQGSLYGSIGIRDFGSTKITDIPEWLQKQNETAKEKYRIAAETVLKNAEAAAEAVAALEAQAPPAANAGN